MLQKYMIFGFVLHELAVDDITGVWKTSIQNVHGIMQELKITASICPRASRKEVQNVVPRCLVPAFDCVRPGQGFVCFLVVDHALQTP